MQCPVAFGRSLTVHNVLGLPYLGGRRGEIPGEPGFPNKPALHGVVGLYYWGWRHRVGSPWTRGTAQVGPGLQPPGCVCVVGREGWGGRGWVSAWSGVGSILETLPDIYSNIPKARRTKCIIMVIITIIIIIIFTRVGARKWLYLDLLPTIWDDTGNKLHTFASLIDLAWFQGRLLTEK